MKIKVTKSCFGTKFHYSAGDVVEVSEEHGTDLINCGFAEEIKLRVKKDTKQKGIQENADA